MFSSLTLNLLIMNELNKKSFFLNLFLGVNKL